MAYRRFHRQSRPTPRDIVVKYAGKCACCGAMVAAGELATYYPAGSFRAEAAIAHTGGLDGNNSRCATEIGRQMREREAVNDFAGEGVDTRYEDDCAEICGR
jgi:hypothetical protein